MSEFKTADLALAAFLVVEGHMPLRFQAVDGSSPIHAQCVFEATDRLTQLVDEYHMGDAAVDPKDFQKKVAYVRRRMRGAVEAEAA